LLRSVPLRHVASEVFVREALVARCDFFGGFHFTFRLVAHPRRSARAVSAALEIECDALGAVPHGGYSLDVAGDRNRGFTRCDLAPRHCVVAAWIIGVAYAPHVAVTRKS